MPTPNSSSGSCAQLALLLDVNMYSLATAVSVSGIRLCTSPAALLCPCSCRDRALWVPVGAPCRCAHCRTCSSARSLVTAVPTPYSTQGRLKPWLQDCRYCYPHASVWRPPQSTASGRSRVTVSMPALLAFDVCSRVQTLHAAALCNCFAQSRGGAWQECATPGCLSDAGRHQQLPRSRAVYRCRRVGAGHAGGNGLHPPHMCHWCLDDHALALSV